LPYEARNPAFLGAVIELPLTGWQLQEVGDSEALNCLPPQNLIGNTKHNPDSYRDHLTTEPPISCSIYVKAVGCATR